MRRAGQGGVRPASGGRGEDHGGCLRRCRTTTFIADASFVNEGESLRLRHVPRFPPVVGSGGWKLDGWMEEWTVGVGEWESGESGREVTN